MTELIQGAFASLMNSPEMVAHRAEREQEREQLRRAAIAEFGSEEAVFAETAEEKALSAAVESFKVWNSYIDPDGAQHQYVSGLRGATIITAFDKVPTAIKTRLRNAIPMAVPLRALADEYRRWEAIYQRRSAFDDNYEPEEWVRIRNELLEEALTTRPAQSWDDLEARIEWWGEMIELDRASHIGNELQPRIAADLKHLRVTA